MNVSPKLHNADTECITDNAFIYFPTISDLAIQYLPRASINPLSLLSTGWSQSQLTPTATTVLLNFFFMFRRSQHLVDVWERLFGKDGNLGLNVYDGYEPHDMRPPVYYTGGSEWNIFFSGRRNTRQQLCFPWVKQIKSHTHISNS